MGTFTPLFGNDQLYATQVPVGNLLYLVLPRGVARDKILLDEAWSSPSLGGTFVYAAAGLPVGAENSAEFVAAVLGRVGSGRGFLWAHPGVQTGPLMGLSPTADAIVTGLDVPIAAGLRFGVGAPAALRLDGTAVTVSGAPSVGYSGDCAPSPTGPVTTARLELDGAGVGVIGYQASFTGSSLLEASSWGLQFAHPAADGAVTAMWLPFAAAPTAPVSFGVAIDPSSPLNGAVGGPARSRMGFDDTAGKIVLASCYRTRQGAQVSLVPKTVDTSEPAGLVFDRGATGRSVMLAPAGDFDLYTQAGPEPGYLMCGLSGTEAVTFQTQRTGNPDQIRFTPYQPGYAPAYPFGVSSPVGPPTDPSAPLLDPTYTTSWATITAATAKPLYVAQPAGSALYGAGDSSYSSRGVLAWADPSDGLPPGVPFPLAGYGTPPAGWTGAQAADFERQVIAPTRRAAIGTPATAVVPAPLYTVTTPSGQIVTIDNGRWTSILIGAASPKQVLCFTDPVPELQQAFQSASLFLVAANGAYLGDQRDGDGRPDGDPAFYNTIEIGGWRLAANVGSGNAYGDYRNVMIVKGRRGKLYDTGSPADSLVANPDKWTQQDFAIPTPAGPDGEWSSRQRRELVVLSQWLQDYFGTALASGDQSFDRFKAIAADPNWTGTLFLRVDVTSVPDDLVGIMAGVADPGGFAAHHLGVEVTPVTGGGATGPTTTGVSSIFGLIDYTDPGFSRLAAKPVRPAAGTSYDFRLLELGVLFTNTAVGRFASTAQLTATTWFDMPVDRMGEGGNRFCALLLTGTLQTNDGLPVYSMTSSDDAQFYVANDVVRKVEITGAVMSTRSTGDEEADDEKDKLAGSWFGLSGFLDFEIILGRDPDEQGNPVPLDLFSFGSAPGTDQARHGLAFSNLGILMSFPPDSPADRVFTFDAGQIQFDIGTSTPRPGSLFSQFAPQVRGLVSGGVTTPPSRSGYLQVVTDARLAGVERGPWWGIDYLLSMGSAGHLAGQAGLNSHLLTAWSPRRARGAGPRDDNRTTASPYQATIGLMLPGTGGGAKLISLQSVLRLSVGQLWLRYDTTKKAFLLLLSEIALKVLGLGSLPPGSTLFYLYGDPGGGGTPSGLGWYAMYRKEAAGR